MYIGAIIDGNKHVTLAFNGHNETKKQYKDAVAALAATASRWAGGMIMAQFGALERFTPANVWVTRVVSAGLFDFRDLLLPQLDLRGVPWSNEFSYKPHVTMTKWKRPRGPYKGLIEITHLAVVSDTYGNTEVLL